MKRFLKSQILKIPFVKRLINERDILLIEKASLRNEIDNLTDQVISLQNDRESMISQLSACKELINELKNELALLNNENNIYTPFVKHGHFYSPIPTIDDVKSMSNLDLPDAIPGINLNTKNQLSLLDKFHEFYKQLPFPDNKIENIRYYFDNPSYSYSDAIFLYCMIRHSKPERIIEVGSGYSSCVILDTNEIFFNNNIRCRFIEPYPELLKSLIKSDDRSRIEIHEEKLQDIDLDLFKELQANDILFIDSTHVSKLNSDVNYLIHYILPELNSGVFIHVHDVFYPFEYPQEWFINGRSWNEQYILRAFLEYNSGFEIVFFNTYLQATYKDRFEQKFPLVFKNEGGSIWLRKL